MYSSSRENEHRQTPKPYFETEQYRERPVYAKSEPVAEKEPVSGGILSSVRGFLSGIESDDILIIALFILLFNENKQDDYLILLILAVLLLS